MGYYSILAKREGIAFANTTLSVILHGPTRWVVEGNSAEEGLHNEKMNSPGELEVDFMERRSVELADFAIAASQYLVGWAGSRNWKLPQNVYLLPFLPGAELNNLPTPRALEPETVDEIVFFGRLEARKGLSLFCDALDELLVYAPDFAHSIRVTFLGRALEHSLDYIQSRSEQQQWPFEVRFLSHYSRSEALNYLSQGNRRLTVIPSLVDNAPYTVYECLFAGIPFIASNVDSIGSLVTEEDRSRVLFSPNPMSLQEKLYQTWKSGLVPAQGVFSKDSAEESWNSFYRMISQTSFAEKPIDSFLPLVSVCITHYNRPELLTQLLDSVRFQDYSHYEIILVDDGSTDIDALELLEEIEINPQKFSVAPIKVIRTENRYLGAARNTAARNANGKYLLFLDDDNYAKENQISTYVRAALHTGAVKLTAAHDIFRGLNAPLSSQIEATWVPLGDSVEVGLFKNCFGDANFFVDRKVFLDVGGFSEEVNMGYEDYEFHVKMALAGYQQEVIPESLLYYRMHDVAKQMLFTTDLVENQMRVVRQYAEALGDNEEILTLLVARLLEAPECNRTVGTIVPRIFTLEGGPITIEGEGFTCGDETIEVYFLIDTQQFDCEDINVISDEELTCTIPAVPEAASGVTLFVEWVDQNDDRLALPFGTIDFIDSTGPTFSQIQMSSFGVVTVTFTQPFRVEGITNPCDVFTQQGVTLRTCNYEFDDEGNRIRVVISDSNLVPGDVLTLRPETVLHLTLEDSFGSGSATVPQPDVVFVPTLQITAPSDVSCASSITIDASGTITVLPPLTFSFSPVDIPEVSDAQVISDALTDASGSRVTFQINEEGVYVINVTATNRLGGSSSSVVTINAFFGTIVPIVNMLSPAEITTTRDATLWLSAEAFPAPCAGAETSLTFLWSIPTESPNTFTLNAATSTTRSLYIAPRTLEAGLTYIIRFSATQEGQVSFRQVKVIVSYSPLIAAINGGGSRSVNAATTGLLLNGTNSRDPDEASGTLSYLWTCSPSCNDRFSDATLATPTLNIDFAENATLTITLEVTKGSRSSSATQIINVIAGVTIPEVVVDPFRGTLIPSAPRLSLNGRVLLGGPATGWQWTVSPALNLSDFRTPIDGPNLVVRRNRLIPGQRYTFTVAATNAAGATGSASVQYQIAFPPSGGILEAERVSGTSFSDSIYEFRLLNWAPRIESELTYSFGYFRNGELVSLTEKLPSNKWRGRFLPEGPLSIQGTVFDRIGSATTVTLNTTLLPVGAPIDSQNALVSINTALASGEVDEATYFAAVTTVFDDAVAQGNADPALLAEIRETATDNLLDQILNAPPTLQSLELWISTINSILRDANPTLSEEALVKISLIAAAVNDAVEQIVAQGGMDADNAGGILLAFGRIAKQLADSTPEDNSIAIVEADERFHRAKDELSFLLLGLLSAGEDPVVVVEDDMVAYLVQTETEGGVFNLTINVDGNSVAFDVDDVEGAAVAVLKFSNTGRFTNDSTSIEDTITVNAEFSSDGRKRSAHDLGAGSITIGFPTTLPDDKMGVCMYFDVDTGLFVSDDTCYYEESIRSCICSHLTDYALGAQDRPPSSEPDPTVPIGPVDPTNNVTWIVVGVVCGVIIVAVLILGGVVLYRKKQRGDQVVPVVPEPAPSEEPKEEKEPSAEEENAAVKIQSLVRGHQARKGMAEEAEAEQKEEKEEEVKQEEAPQMEEKEKEEEKEPEPPLPNVVPETEEKEAKKKPVKGKKKVAKGKKKAVKGKSKEERPPPTPEEEAAATKIQNAYRRHLARVDIQREREIEALLVDIDDLLALDM